MRLCDPLLNPLLDAATAYFGGGGGAPKAPKQRNIELPPAPSYQIPSMPAIPPPPEPRKPDPIPTSSALDVQQSQAQLRADAIRRKGIRKTLIAGEANQKPASPVTGSTLLG